MKAGRRAATLFTGHAMRKSPAAPKPVFHTPTQMNWTDEKLAALSSDQLVTLLRNLHVQRSSGRVLDETADDLTKRIYARLPTRVVNLMIKQAKAAQAATSGASE
jgi:hypothetical protein